MSRAHRLFLVLVLLSCAACSSVGPFTGPEPPNLSQPPRSLEQPAR